MRVLEAAKVGHRYPGVLIHFLRVRWGDTCLSGEGEFRNCVRVHLLRVA